MDVAGEDVGSFVGEPVVDLVAVAAMGDATEDNGVDVEPEAEREHQATVAPPSGADQLPGSRYVPDEEGVVPDGVGSR